MTFDELKTIENETERVAALYELLREDMRLTCSKAARVEFFTTVHFINRYLKKGSKIIDIGAGAGAYSLHFANQGYEVSAVELAPANVKVFQSKLLPEHKIQLYQGNACDLSRFEDESFDLVLLLGPLYHLEQQQDRCKCIREAKRVCKKGGVILFSFISNDMVILTETFCYDLGYLLGDSYDRGSFKVEDFPFVFFTVDDARSMLLEEGIQIEAEVGSDGVSELLHDKINAMDEETYRNYLAYHLYCCEKPEMLGRSNHLLFVGRVPVS